MRRADLMFREALTTLRGPDLRVELDRKALFALASDTRLDILRALQPMRRTVTQLAESVGVDKAAVYRHLKTLEGGGFVKRYEDHGFVYYGLTWKARDIIAPGENSRIVVLISASIAIMFVAFMVGTMWTLATDPGTMTPNAPKSSDYGDVTPDSSAAEDTAASLLLAAVFGASALALAAAAVWRSKKPRQSRAPEERPYDGE